jgi:transposase InsO family protein
MINQDPVIWSDGTSPQLISTRWLTDITEHPTLEGKLYLCSIKDCCSNRIVGYAIDERMTAQLQERTPCARHGVGGTLDERRDRASTLRMRV